MKNIFSDLKCSRVDVLCAAFSAILLTLSFPQTDYFLLAWIGLVPLLFALRGKSLWESWKVGYFTGLFFFWGTLYWFVHVTVVGAFFLLAYFSVYFGLFGVGYYFLTRKKNIAQVFLLPCLWVVLEYARSRFLTGFGWVSLGYSQCKNSLVLQLADIAGVYGVSFLIVLVNVVLFLWITKQWKTKQQGWIYSSIVIVIFICIVVYGKVRFEKYHLFRETIKVSLIQGNVDQNLKWSRAAWPVIMDKHMTLTVEAIQSGADLIVWPETSFPGFLWEDVDHLQRVVDVAKKDSVSILIGSISHEGEDYYNSAVMIDSYGQTDQVYNKLHRVPFGEYIPFRKYFPKAINNLIPIEDLTPGEIHTIFKLKNNFSFAAVICFEDTVDYLAREFTQKGAQFLVNMTNDAWFKQSKSPFLHLQGAVFRAVENRRYLVRSANTGVSAIIDPRGEVVGQLKDDQGGSIFMDGVLSGRVGLGSDITFYTRYGNIFVGICLGFLVFGYYFVIKNNNN